MKKKMRYLAIAAAIAVLMSAGGCGKQEVVETATDVAAVESASDIVTTTVGTEQTTTVSSTSAQEEITLVTATEPTTAEKSVETAKATQNTTKKTNAKATTTKATVKAVQKATTKATTKKTTTTTKAQGLTDEDYQWVLNEALKYIKTLPKAEIDKTASAYSFERIFVNHLKARNAALNNLKEAIDVEYKSFCWDGGIGMNIELCKDDVGDYYYKLRYIAYIN